MANEQAYEDYLANWRVEGLRTRPLNGFMIKYFDEIDAAWSGWILQNEPLLKSIYDALEDKPPGTTIWAGEFRSGGRAIKVGGRIWNYFADLAEQDAIANRKLFDWSTGHDQKYYIDPNGKTTGPNGQHYGRWTAGWDY
jgi:hypothetical protein